MIFGVKVLNKFGTADKQDDVVTGENTLLTLIELKLNRK